MGSTAILSYDLDETETIAGQNMRARYHTTDTWLRRHGAWQIISEQAPRYYADPAPGKPDIAKYADYVGVYELAPGKTLEVSSEGEALFSQRNGKEKEPLVTESIFSEGCGRPPTISQRCAKQGRRVDRPTE